MVFPYWEINPEELIKSSACNSSLQAKKNLSILIQEYKKTSNQINKIIKKITEKNFLEQLELFFDREAYLAEIYFYLTEDIELLNTEKNILDRINKDYILSYFTHLEDEERQNCISEPVLKIWLKREYSKAFNKKFSNR